MFFELFLIRIFLSSQARFEPTTFWSPVRRSNHWALTILTIEPHERLAVAMSYIEIKSTLSHLSHYCSTVTASHRRSEACGFESRLGTQKKNHHNNIHVRARIHLLILIHLICRISISCISLWKAQIFRYHAVDTIIAVHFLNFNFY